MTPHMIEQERRIVEILADKKLGHIEVAESMGFSRTAAQKYMAAMHKRSPKVIYISEYEQPLTGGYPRPLFSVGNLPDVVYVPKNIKKAKRPVPRSEEKKARILELLTTPMTGRELAAAVFLSNEQTMDYVRLMRESTPKLVFVKAYRKAAKRGQWAPVYAVGNRPDAKHPGKQTRAERYKQERKDEDAVRRANQRRKHDYLIKTLKATPVSWASALGL